MKRGKGKKITMNFFLHFILKLVKLRCRRWQKVKYDRKKLKNHLNLWRFLKKIKLELKFKLISENIKFFKKKLKCFEIMIFRYFNQNVPLKFLTLLGFSSSFTRKTSFLFFWHHSSNPFFCYLQNVMLNPFLCLNFNISFF